MIETLILWKLWNIEDKIEGEPSGEDGYLWMVMLGSLLWPVGIYFVVREYFGRSKWLALFAAAGIGLLTILVLPVYLLISLILVIYGFSFLDKLDKDVR
jgi:uncharacterized membrane protein